MYEPLARNEEEEKESPDFLTADESETENATFVTFEGSRDSKTETKSNHDNGNHFPGPDDGFEVDGLIPLEARPLLSDEEDTVFNLKEETFTVEDAVEHMGFGKFQLKLFFICGLFSATDALEMLLLSVLSPVLRCEWLLPELNVAFITTVVFTGMWIGSYLWGSLSDKFGRLSVILIAAVWILYFGILTSFSPNYWWILFLRCAVGFGFGGALQSFTLQSEYLPSKYRAKVLIVNNIYWAIGICFEINWAMGSCFEVWMAYLIIPTLGWRWLVAISALPSILSVIFIWTLPESARFLVAAGRKEEAKTILEKASKTNGKTLPPGRLVQSVQARRGHMRDLFTSEYLRTTLSVWLLWFGTAFSYYGMVLAQSEILEFHKTCGSAAAYEESAMTEDCHCNLLTKNDYKQMIIATFGEFAVIPLNLVTIDRLGRRWTLIINYLGAGTFFLLIQLCVPPIVETLFIFGVRAFTAGIFNTVYIYTSEVYPTTVRSLGLGSGSAMARIGAMITPFVAQVMLQWSLRVSLGIYGGLCVLCAITAFSLPIETLGRELKQSQAK